jgi:major type 1 subunit fimbrin (pilin)
MMSLVLLAGSFSGSVLAIDSVGGEVTFFGRLVPQPCTVNPESLDMTVPLEPVNVKTLVANGGKGADNAFSIGLSGCKTSVKDTVRVMFNGQVDPDMAGLLQTTGTAKGVALRLLNKDLSNLDINTQSLPITLVDGSNALNFFVRVETNDASKVVGGPYEASATFTLSYQ